MTKSTQINWGPAIFLIAYQAILLVSLPFYFYYYPLPPKGIIIASIILLYLTGLSITGGYHRYYAHRTYRTGSVVEAILLFFGSMTAQGSALRWSFDHRIHHAHVDTDEDPYSIKKGFWYAHFLWILEKPRTIESKIVPDLLRNKLVMFQHHYYVWLMIGTNALVVIFLGWLFNDYAAAFFIACWLRLFALHHFTWFINSLAHTWGDKPFSQELSAVDNYFISLLTFGEGYHNYHHTFANDYRNGIHWFHFDPTKWMIWTLNKLGFVHNLKRTDKLTIKKRIVQEGKVFLLEHVKKVCGEKKDEWELLIQEVSERILAKITHLNALKEDYLRKKSQKDSLNLIKELRGELKNLQKSLKEDWSQWMTLSKKIMRLESQLVPLKT